MFPTSAAKIGLKSEQAKTKQHEQEILQMEKQLLQMKAQYPAQSQAKPPKIQTTQATSFSQQQSKITISGIGQIIPTKTIKTTPRQSTAKPQLSHEIAQQMKFKREATPTKKPAQPLNQLSDNCNSLYAKAVGKLGVIDVNFTSKADDLTRQVLQRAEEAKAQMLTSQIAPRDVIRSQGGYKVASELQQARNQSAKSDSLTQVTEEAPVKKYDIVYDQVDSNCGFETAAPEDQQQVDLSKIPNFMSQPQVEPKSNLQNDIQSEYDLFQDDDKKQTASCGVGGDEAVTFQDEKPENLTANCQVGQNAELEQQQAQTGQILDGLIKQIQNAGQSRESRRMELINQLAEEEGSDNFTVEELLAEMQGEKP
ncbi:hypothetical protein SS50377_25529 [Spironucleus salmonicida]|uniref:Uncharacterized protein n=1 Tax=Spironucleus salmonicida TaxID=348837 RepID=V6LKI2_9EUKA|nr:hypothetical protein SS50377_25529 [Spironucleus salmonicida]|eukprot:EST45077.1 Hypothetical protein SS50377_15097 [Spironucleus salmonicida]